MQFEINSENENPNVFTFTFPLSEGRTGVAWEHYNKVITLSFNNKASHASTMISLFASLSLTLTGQAPLGCTQNCGYLLANLLFMQS
jgi:hypothetical protein